MSRSLLHLVMKHAEGLIASPEAEPDSELLLRFVRTRDEAAFAELLRRHGPMVWSVCRHSLSADADAEDAFQATFLALIRSASAVRSGPAIAGWLHGVAVRVAAKVKRSSVRRRQREQRAAGPEADRTVPEAAWEALLAAVHEEVQRLPAALRTAFVLCELEGVRQPEAAARLGWKAGTLSGRLTRARQLLLQRLSSRGLAPALAGGTLGLGVATATAAALPGELTDKAMSLIHAGGAVSPVVLKLASEVMPMMIRTKLAAAAIVVAGGLGTLLFPMAAAQQPGGLPGQSDAGGAPQEKPRLETPRGRPLDGPRSEPQGGGRPGAGLRTGGYPPLAPSEPPRGGLPPGVPESSPQARAMMSGHTQWEYKFVAAGSSAKDVVQLFTEMGNEGWEYCGTQEFSDKQLAEAMKLFPDKVVRQPGAAVTQIFKRPGGMIGGRKGFGGGSAMGSGGGGGGVPKPMAGSGGGIFNRGPGGPPDPFTPSRPGDPNGQGGSRPGLPPLPPDSRPRGAGPMPAPQGPPVSAPLTIIKLKNAWAAAEFAVAIEKVFPNVSVTAVPRSNSLIIRADKKMEDEIRDLIERLDADTDVRKPPMSPPVPRSGK
jgi:RNA polymerase sigma factor (sigma-70 family)